MPSPFAFPPPPPPPPKASANYNSQGPAHSSSQGQHARNGDARTSRGRGQGHNSRGGRGNGTNSRGRGGLNQRGGSGGRGGSSDRIENAGQSRISVTGAHNSFSRQESNTPGFTQNENTGAAITGAYNYGLANQAMPWSPEGITQFMNPQMQQYAAYTAAAQMMWNSQAFQASLSQAQANVASGWSNSNGRGYSNPSDESHSLPVNNRHQGNSNRGNRTQRGRQQSPRGKVHTNHNKPQNRPRPSVAPAVPSFGFSLPAPPAPAPLPKPTRHSKNKKRKLNQLGLTPQEDAQYSSEEELIDEEAMWIGFKGPITIEHNGRICKLSTAADIMAWKAERKREFPTSARIEQKRRDMEITRERLVRLQQKVRLQKHSKTAQVTREQISEPAVGPEEDAQRTLEKQRQKVEYLRKRLLDSEKKFKLAQLQASPPAQPNEESAPQQRAAHSASNAQQDSSQSLEAAHQDNLISPQKGPQDAAAQGVNLSLGYTTDFSDDVSVDSVDEASDTDTSSLSSSSSESSSSEDSDSDDAPEIQSSRPTQPIRVAPPKRQPKPETKTIVCGQYAKRGICSKEERCRFEHPPKPLRVKKRVTLLERFKTQEQKEEHRLALEAIKYLGNNGFLD